MTQEEKARAYDEALEKAEMYYDNAKVAGDYSAVARYENIFPELIESEDERIRKGLCEFIHDTLNDEMDNYNITKQDALAWLEKQKEQKPDDDIRRVPFASLNPPPKIPEQTPAECLKVERDGWYVCIKDYYCGGKKRSSVGDLVQAKGGMHIMGEKDISEWFRRAYYEEVRDAFGPNTDTNIPEKSAEWSEEDEEMLKDIIRDIEWERRNTTIDKDIRAYDMELSWLKSLRPSWKPSEEQMKALIDCTIGNEYDVHALVRLFAELKKLM